MWTVVWVRPLKLTNPDDKALNEGKVYNFSFAVHDDNITTRGHHVSFPVTVGFGAKAAIEATKLKMSVGMLTKELSKLPAVQPSFI